MYGFVITTAGTAMLNRAGAGELLTITSVTVGSGVVASAEAAKALTALITPVAAATSSTPAVSANQCSMIVEYRNDMNGGLETGFDLSEFGIFAKVGDDAPALLYYASLGDSPQPVQPESQGLDVHRFPVAIALTDEIAVTLGYPSGVLLTSEDLETALEGYIPSTEKGAANGVAELDENGKVKSDQMPAMNYLPTAGGTMTGPINMGGKAITNLPKPTGETEPLRKQDAYLKEETLSDETKAALGDVNTPDEALGALLERVEEVPDQIEPVGTIKQTVRTDLGDQWLLCNGDVVDATQYPDLASLLPTYRTDSVLNSSYGIENASGVAGDGRYIILTGNYTSTAFRPQVTVYDTNRNTVNETKLTNDNDEFKTVTCGNGFALAVYRDNYRDTLQKSGAPYSSWASITRPSGSTDIYRVWYSDGYYFVYCADGKCYYTDDISSDSPVWNELSSPYTTYNMTVTLAKKLNGKWCLFGLVPAASGSNYTLGVLVADTLDASSWTLSRPDNGSVNSGGRGNSYAVNAFYRYGYYYVVYVYYGNSTVCISRCKELGDNTFETVTTINGIYGITSSAGVNAELLSDETTLHIYALYNGTTVVGYRVLLNTRTGTYTKDEDPYGVRMSIGYAMPTSDKRDYVLCIYDPDDDIQSFQLKKTLPEITLAGAYAYIKALEG